MEEKLYRQSRLCRLLGNPVVYSIVAVLHEQGTMTPTQIVEAVGQQHVTSRHGPAHEAVGHHRDRSIDVRRAGGHVAHCCGQLEADLEGVTAEQMAGIVIAYEPVWAIGTGKVATVDQAREAHQVVRATLDRVVAPGIGQSVAVLYGGSGSDKNAVALFAEPEVDGALVGGASLEAAGFWRICAAAAVG